MHSPYFGFYSYGPLLIKFEAGDRMSILPAYLFVLAWAIPKNDS